MQVIFTRWCIDPKGRTPVSVNPKRVDYLEFFCAAFAGSDVQEALPAGTTITMQGRKERFTVQGSVAEVQSALNEVERNTK